MSPVGAIFVPFPLKTGTNVLHPLPLSIVERVKRRLSDHWGTGAHDNYPLVRACMPRDLFVLFYSRFFHMAPTIGKLNKDDPDHDTKHNIRYIPPSPWANSTNSA